MRCRCIKLGGWRGGGGVVLLGEMRMDPRRRAVGKRKIQKFNSQRWNRRRTDAKNVTRTKSQRTYSFDALWKNPSSFTTPLSSPISPSSASNPPSKRPPS